MDLERFEELPLMGIVRGVPLEKIEPLLEAVIEAGLKTIEITMNTEGAGDIIKKAKEVSRGRITVGAGTVLSRESLEEALDAGASFIVLPANIEEVVTPCIERNIPVFPGAFTPQEVIDCWKKNPTMIKIFPSSMFGPKYIKMLKGPYDDVKLMAVGGVRLENIKEYFSQGADAVAFGGGVFTEELLDKNDFSSIGSKVKEYVDEAKEACRAKL
ncbi:bifunctional 4-hydroxy-2-oxoglutarate aldolase/2-dehydro-3-deoxy-phosphogluconate aldolase [Candidatus Omnitrophota bacterium]